MEGGLTTPTNSHRNWTSKGGHVNLGSSHQLLQEQPHDVVMEEPITVLGERSGMPDHIVGAQAHKPAEQQVLVEVLQQQPLGADPIERLQQRGQQQLLR